MSARGRCTSSRNLGQFPLAPVRARTPRQAGPRRSRTGVGLGEDLESRIVLSYAGGNLLGSALNAIGVVTGPVLAPSATTPTRLADDDQSGDAPSQFRQDVQALQTELASLAAKSGVTVADLTGLAADSRALVQGGKIDVKSLDAAVDELATAIAGGTSTSQAQTDFAAVFSGTSVTQATIAQAFTDLSQAITASGVTSTDLTTVAADRAAIKVDLSNLQGGSGQSGHPGSTSGGGGCMGGGSPGTGNGSTSPGSGSSSPGSGGSSSGSGSGSSSPSSGGSPTGSGSGSSSPSSGGNPTGSGSGSSSPSSGGSPTGSGSGSSSPSSGGSSSGSGSGSSSGGSITVTTPSSEPPLPTLSATTTVDPNTTIDSTTTPDATATSTTDPSSTSTSTDGSTASSGTTTTSTGHKATKGHKSGTHAGHVSVKVHAAKTQARSQHSGGPR